MAVSLLQTDEKPVISRWRQTHFQEVRISEVEMAHGKGLHRLSKLGFREICAVMIHYIVEALTEGR
jgi:hypothetical protein